MKQIGTLFGTLVILALFAGCSGGESMRKESILKDTSIGKIEGARDGWDVISQPFGEVDDQEVTLFTLRNPNGMIVELSNYGGAQGKGFVWKQIVGSKSETKSLRT